jgi:20S proteasome alpha/beta subunit
MTLIAALQAKDGVILAADSRGTIGDPAGLVAINDGIQKLFPLTNFAGIMVSGMNELGAKLIDEIKGQLQPDQDADVVMEKVRQVSTQRVDGWFPGFLTKSPHEKASLGINVIFVIGGYKTGGGLPMEQRLFSLPSIFNFMPFLHTTGYALAGVPQYATYLLHRIYDRNLLIERVAEIAAFVITETASQEPKVGGPIQMAQVTPAGFYQFPAEKVSDILESNKKKSESLGGFFREARK